MECGNLGDLLLKLGESQRRGSKPRCHLMTHGASKEVAKRLTKLMAPYGEVTIENDWMPAGFDELTEAQLHKQTKLLPEDVGASLGKWWLEPHTTARTPCFDIASTCNIDGKPGILLVEAKAHHKEMLQGKYGKKLDKNASEKSRSYHSRICKATQTANRGLEKATKLKWNLSRDSHYQLSNRFAWAWKLTELGYPVILLYLGFINADDLKPDEKVLSGYEGWLKVVSDHSRSVVPKEAWNTVLQVNGQSLIPLIRTEKILLRSKNGRD